jgi:hypothetical protein
MKVTRAWLHPAMIRELDDGLHARSFERQDGPTSYFGFDVAVLELSAQGPD